MPAIINVKAVMLCATFLRGISAQFREIPGHEDKWLEDYDTFPEEMLADSPFNRPIPSSVGGCPPQPEVMSRAACEAIACQADADCVSHRPMRCCFNGCVKSCQHAIPAPSFVDWQQNPSPQDEKDSHWLVPGENSSAPVKWCSTSFLFGDDDDDGAVRQPYLCAPGYTCHIDYPEDTKSRAPNRGHCVPDLDSDLNEEPFLQRSNPIQTHHGTCQLRNAILKNGEQFIYNKHMCSCNESAITCNVSVVVV